MSDMSYVAVKINQKVSDEWQSGISVSELAKKYGVCHQMIRTRIKSHARNTKREIFSGLSIRVCNSLQKAGFTSDIAVIEKFNENKKFFCKLRNFGKKSFLELEQWVLGDVSSEFLISSKLEEIRNLTYEVERLVKSNKEAA
jgi:hypothetical protein